MHRFISSLAKLIKQHFCSVGNESENIKTFLVVPESEISVSTNKHLSIYSLWSLKQGGLILND